MQSINPATGTPIRTYAPHSDAEVELRIAAAERAYRDWRFEAVEKRAGYIRRAAAVLRACREEFAVLMTREMGKTIGGARAEIDKCAWLGDYYADEAASFLNSTLVETDAKESYVAYRPLGLCLGIMPWNFPFWQAFRFALPALLAGNGVLLKHAPSVPGCAVAIEQVFEDAGFPDGIFSTLLIEANRVGRVIDDRRVATVSLTGSTRAGKAVAKRAAATLTKTVLELGGSDPYLVLEDADLDRTVETCVVSRLINSGQSCIAAKRIIVVEAIRKPFTDRFLERMSEARLGDPMENSTDVGPLARADLRDELHDQVERSCALGAYSPVGGEVPERSGFWYPPTVLTHVRPGMPAFDEELFGPVAAIIGSRDEGDAIALANQSPYGLGAAVFTADLERGRAIAELELEAGACFVNAFVRSDPRLPFGGIKESGYGRELGVYGLREFTNIKTVYIG
ncbi:MAG: NAD-dependent succinate-semialdehyde dehydrogenase [Myxococcota bacterium]